MSFLAKVQDDPSAALWEQLSEVTAVMLGVEGGDNFMRPMAPQADPDENTIWFYAKKSSELFSELDSGKIAHLCLVNEDKHFWACVKGRLMEAFDPKVIDRFWSPSVEAWYEDGKKDSDLTLLAFHPHAAEISCSSNSKLRFGWEVMKANVKKEEMPDMGMQVIIPMSAAARH